MTTRKTPETPDEYRAHQRRMRERFACDCDKQLDKDVKVLRKAQVVLEVWRAEWVAAQAAFDAIESAIAHRVDEALKAQGL